MLEVEADDSCELNDRVLSLLRVHCLTYQIGPDPIYRSEANFDVDI